MSLLVSLLETAMIAALVRLVVQWSPGTVVLWVVAVAALAAAAAGLIIRWHDLPVRSRFMDSLGPGTVPGEGTGPETPARRGPASTATALRKHPKKPKKEPGWAAVAGNACCLGAVVALSFFVG